MRRQAITLTALVCGIIMPALSQYHVDPRNRGERIIVVVPMIGSGVLGDSKRPIFAPSPDEMRKSGVYEFRYEVSDDGRYAIVEVAARDKAALDAIAKDARTIKAFEKGKHRKEDIERELKIHKRDFVLGPSAVALPGVVTGAAR